MNSQNAPKEWLDEYNVNIVFIDEQHKYFFRVLKELEKVVKGNSCQETIPGIFFSVVHYVDHYLIQEEIYFRGLNFPGFKEHHLKHDLFVTGIINMKDDFATGKKDVCKNLLVFMTDYFYDHILGYDLKAVEYLNSLSLKN